MGSKCYQSISSNKLRKVAKKEDIFPGVSVAIKYSYSVMIRMPYGRRNSDPLLNKIENYSQCQLIFVLILRTLLLAVKQSIVIILAFDFYIESCSEFKQKTRKTL